MPKKRSIFMEEKIFESIKTQILAFNEPQLIEKINEALGMGISPADIISKGLSSGLEIVGQKFENGEFFLPELMLSGNIMKNAIDKLRPLMVNSNGHSLGKVMLGTVEGDIHYIGKNIFSAVLEGDGYDVYDIGEDVPPHVFLAKAKEIDPDIIGMSALISIAVTKMAETILLLKDHDIKSKIVVGGAAVTSKNSKTIGADGYGFDAWQGVRMVRKLTERSV
jgi:5-methyltetrahydrofolate--homocysteine methyltransferase